VFKINYGKIPDFKTNGEAFYAKTKNETKMMYYGFGFEVGQGILEHERAHCIEGYTDASGLEAHLENVGPTFGHALTMASLERLDCMGPPEAIAQLKKHQVLKDCNTKFFTLDGKGVRKKLGNYENCVILAPTFKIHAGKEQAFKDNGEEFYKLTKKEPAMLYYGFAYTEDGFAFCREGYVDAKGLLAHLDNVGATFGKALGMSELVMLECFAPRSELTVLQQNKVLQDCKCKFFERDGKGIKG
jgi:quinol monooxygenase YgiN